MFNTIKTVFILVIDELWVDCDLNNWVYLIGGSLKQPNILLSIICKAFEYFWNTLVDLSSEPYDFTT